MNTLVNWIKTHVLMSVGIAVAVVWLLFPRSFKRLFKAPRKRRRRSRTNVNTYRPRRRTSSGRKLPRSVGTRKRKNSGSAAASRGSNRKGYAAVGGGTIPFKYNKDGSVKAARLVAGTIAAKRAMSKIRR